MDNNSLTVIQAKEAELQKKLEEAKQKAQEKINKYLAEKEAELKNLPAALKKEQADIFAQDKKKLEQALADLTIKHQAELAKLDNISSAQIDKLAQKIVKQVLA